MVFSSIGKACVGALALALSFGVALPTRADEFTPTQKDAIGERIQSRRNRISLQDRHGFSTLVFVR